MSAPPPGVDDGVCARCGAPLARATAHLSELGPVCWPCSEFLQTTRVREQRQVAAQGNALDSRARRLAVVHFVIWGTTTLLVSRALPVGAAAAALVTVLTLVGALFLRNPWAYPAALVLDGAGTVALVVWGIAAGGLAWLVAIFSLFLVALTLAARDAYPRLRLRTAASSSSTVALGPADSQPVPTLPRAAPLPRWLAPVAVAAMLAGGAVVAIYLLTHRPDPVVTMMRTALTNWQVERGQPDSAPGGPAAQTLIGAARRWSGVATSFELLDRAWPDELATRAAVKSVNLALAGAKLPYMIETWPGPGERPLILSHQVVARVPWRIGERTVDVLRLRRVDNLNADFAMSGVTDEGLPVVLLDRVEAFLARDVPAAYGASRTERASRSLNEFDRAALKHLRAFLDQRFGATAAGVGAALAERDRLVEEMRGRLHDGRLQFGDMPERFILGDAWLASLKPETKSSRAGGPMILDVDLKEVAKADERLRTPEIGRVLDAIIEMDALSVEAHEARHALDEVAPVGLPPPALFEVMPDSSTWTIGAADRELRAFLGELHDGEMSVCASLAMIMRCLYGRGAGRSPHAFAATALLEQLDPRSELEPAEQLDALCRIPDPELRTRIERAWQTLYAVPMPPATRSALLSGIAGHPG